MGSTEATGTLKFGSFELDVRLRELRTGSTRVRYTWSVSLVDPWMRRLKPIAAPIFRWNHNAVMRAGALGLARHLHTTLVAPEPPKST